MVDKLQVHWHKIKISSDRSLRFCFAVEIWPAESNMPVGFIPLSGCYSPELHEKTAVPTVCRLSADNDFNLLSLADALAETGIP